MVRPHLVRSLNGASATGHGMPPAHTSCVPVSHMAKMARAPRNWIALMALLLMAGLTTGCGLDTRFKETVRPLSLSFAVSYENGRSQVSVLYSIPPPPPDMVYVL